MCVYIIVYPKPNRKYAVLKKMQASTAGPPTCNLLGFGTALQAAAGGTSGERGAADLDDAGP